MRVYPAVWSFVASYRYEWSEGRSAFRSASYGIGGAGHGVRFCRASCRCSANGRLRCSGLIFSGLGLLGYAFAWQGWMVYVVIVRHLLENVADPPLRSIAASKVPPSAQGELQGALGSLTSITTIIGPLMFPLSVSLFHRADCTRRLCRRALHHVGDPHPGCGDRVCRQGA